MEPQNFYFTDKFKKLKICTANITMAGSHSKYGRSLLKAPKPPTASAIFSVHSKTN